MLPPWTPRKEDYQKVSKHHKLSSSLQVHPTTYQLREFLYIPGSGLLDQVSKSIIDNVTSVLIPGCLVSTYDKALNILDV
jgi:hypothetical protein